MNRTFKRFILKRDVLKSECDWLSRAHLKDEIVYEYDGPTYGCILSGLAVTEVPDEPPFFELPIDALEPW